MGATMNEVMAKIHDKIKSNPDILKLLYYMDNSKNPLEQPELTLSQTQQVTKNNIYTRKKIAKENESIQCYISMRYGRKVYHHQKNQFFNDNTFNFYILCHDDFDTNEIIGSRVCEIERLIEEMFDDGDVGTVCNTIVTKSIDIDVNGADYSGRHIEIMFIDKNNNMINKVVGG